MNDTEMSNLNNAVLLRKTYSKISKGHFSLEIWGIKQSNHQFVAIYQGQTQTTR